MNRRECLLPLAGAPEPFDASAWPCASTAMVVRVDHGQRTAGIDQVVEEVPVALVYNGISHAVMLATPDDLEELAVGFTLSEGIVSHVGEIYGAELVANNHGIEIQIEIATRHFMALKERRRSLAGRTGCGLCGVESLTAVARDCKAVERKTSVSLKAISAALAALPLAQPLREATGAVHAAAWVDTAGELLALREDVGRHNALDKLIGWLHRSGTAIDHGFALVSSRASFEMVQKAASAGIGCLIAISAPTAMAVRLANESGITLVGFARPGRLVIYTHDESLVMSNESP